MATPTRPALLSGFGLATPSAATLVDVTVDPVADDPLVGLRTAIEAMPARGGIVRGLGRSYGDPAQCAGGRVIRLAPNPESIVLDPDAGTVTVGAGVSIDQLLDVIVPQGWFVPVTPGTRFVTIGGAIASDIHGKNHHVDGSFGQHVTALRMMLADTSVVEVGPDRDPDLFWATVAGMGLTGVVIDATVRLLPIETSRISVDTFRLGHLDDVMSEMVASESGSRYSVAWLDLLATGRARGRGVLTNGDHARVDQLDPRAGGDPLAYGGHRTVALPPLVPPGGVINTASVKVFNEGWHRKAPRRRQGELQSIPAYFHPLDGVRDWNRVYGRQGFVQYQFVVPDERSMRAAIERLSSAHLPIFLVVLKRFGPENRAPLSFPRSGWQLAVDVGVRNRGLGELLASLDRLVLDAGGRHYLAKDFQTTPAAIRRGYPRLPAWQAVRRRVDPGGVWVSDLGRRLGLTP